MADEKLPIAILAAAGFAETTFTDTQKFLLAKGRKVKVISPDGGLVQGWHDGAWGHHFMADEKIADALAADYSALIMPDGKNSAHTLAENVHTKRLIAAFVSADAPVLAIGEAIDLLVKAEIAAGRRLAGSAEQSSELIRAGADWAGDATLATDGRLITATPAASSNERLNTFLELVDDESVPQAA
jgi:protease I